MMKLILIALALSCSLATASQNSTVSSDSAVPFGKILIINNCERQITLIKSGWFLPPGGGEYEFKCGATKGVDTVSWNSKDQRNLNPWFGEKESNYISFWNIEVPVYENRRPSSRYTYEEAVGNARATCEEDPPNTGYVYVAPGHEYHLCSW